MRALILAAGFGERLLPHTRHVPKPLFTVAGCTLLEITIGQLKKAGCTAIAINTHHLNAQIEGFIRQRQFGIPVNTRHEALILGTGGAIKNVADFFGTQPFMVINADILTDCDLGRVYRFHREHRHPVTLVMHDCPPFNQVLVRNRQQVVDFCRKSAPQHDPALAYLAFTGIQVLDPQVLDWIPEGQFSSSIDAYRRLMATGQRICTYMAEDTRWTDIGTPARYRRAVYETLVPLAFKKAFGHLPHGPVRRTALSGDGSDRRWYRLTTGDHSLLLVDHGICANERPSEADAFVKIGSHLQHHGIPVPRIYAADTFAGQVLCEDLGNTHLQQVVRQCASERTVAAIYRHIIDQVIDLNHNGARGFNPGWTFQSPSYDRTLILERECRYFTEAFLNTWMGWSLDFETLRGEFETLADGALKFSHTGFMHRDLQSRNIMHRNGNYFFIDFQAGRLGPLQYDLASLLIDPYVDLPPDLQQALLAHAVRRLSTAAGVNPVRFMQSYTFCALARNLQILGAFGFLSRVKGKTGFARYIPAAVKGLRHRLNALTPNPLPELTQLVERIAL